MPVVNLISSEWQGPEGTSFRRLEQGLPRTLEPPGAPEAPPPDLKPGFLDMVQGFVEDVNNIQLRSGKTIDAFVAGEITDVHQVMVAAQEAGLALDLLLEIRNRTMEAFQEIMRMQV